MCTWTHTRVCVCVSMNESLLLADEQHSFSLTDHLRFVPSRQKKQQKKPLSYGKHSCQSLGSEEPRRRSQLQTRHLSFHRTYPNRGGEPESDLRRSVSGETSLKVEEQTSSRFHGGLSSPRAVALTPAEPGRLSHSGAEPGLLDAPLLASRQSKTCRLRAVTPTNPHPPNTTQPLSH